MSKIEAILEHVKKRVPEELPGFPTDVVWKGSSNGDSEIWKFRVKRRPNVFAEPQGYDFDVDREVADYKNELYVAERIVEAVVRLCENGLPQRLAPDEYIRELVDLT